MNDIAEFASEFDICIKLCNGGFFAIARSKGTPPSDGEYVSHVSTDKAVLFGFIERILDENAGDWTSSFESLGPLKVEDE